MILEQSVLCTYMTDINTMNFCKTPRLCPDVLQILRIARRDAQQINNLLLSCHLVYSLV